LLPPLNPHRKANQVAKITKGRVFYTTPDKLGHSILVDDVASKRKDIGGA